MTEELDDATSDSDVVVAPVASQARPPSRYPRLPDPFRRRAAPKVMYAVAVTSMLVGAVLSPIDYFIVNLALPDIGHSFGGQGAAVQLVIAAYAVSYATGLVPAGRLGDRYGRRRMFLLGVSGFLVASIVCGMAPHIGVLIVGRFLQGSSAALLSPQVLATFRTVLPERLQGPTVAVYGFMFGLGAVIGQVGGGFLLEADLFGSGWRGIFLVNVPVCVAALVGTWVSVRENTASAAKSADMVGASVLMLLVLSVVVPLSLGPALHWPVWCVGCLLAGIPLSWLFYRVETAGTRPAPLVDFRLLRQAVVWRGLALAAMFYTDSVFFMGFGIYLRDGLQWSSVRAAVAFLPFALGFVVGPLAVPLLVRGIRQWTVLFGFLAMFAGFTVLALVLEADTGLNFVAFGGLVCAGVGHGVVLSSIARVLVLGTAKKWSGQISGLVISAMQIGSAVGAAGLGGVLFHVLHARTTPEAYTEAFRAALLSLGAVLFIGVAGAVSLGCALSPAGRKDLPSAR